MKNLFLFTGEHLPELKRKLNFWKNQFLEKYGDLNVEVRDQVSQDSLQEIVGILETQPFLADKRMVIIHGLPQSGNARKKLETEALEAFLPNIPETTLAVFVCPKPDKRLKFYKTLIKHAEVEEFSLPKGKAMLGWIESRAQANNQAMAPGASELMALFCGEDVERIEKELEKLAVLDISTISEKDVQKYVSPSPEAKIFQVLDQLGKGNQQSVLMAFESLLKTGEDLMMVFFMVVRQFRLLVQTRILLDKGFPQGALAKKLKIAPFQVNMYAKQAGYFSAAQLKKAYKELALMDYRIKTGRLPSPQQSPEVFMSSIDQFLCSLYE